MTETIERLNAAPAWTRAQAGELTEVALRLGNRAVPGERSVILDSTPFRTMNNATTWDIHPDGERFVFVTGGAQSSLSYRVLMNATSRPGGR